MWSREGERDGERERDRDREEETNTERDGTLLSHSSADGVRSSFLNSPDPGIRTVHVRGPDTLQSETTNSETSRKQLTALTISTDVRRGSETVTVVKHRGAPTQRRRRKSRRKRDVEKCNRSETQRQTGRLLPCSTQTQGPD